MQPQPLVIQFRLGEGGAYLLAGDTFPEDQGILAVRKIIQDHLLHQRLAGTVCEPDGDLATGCLRIVGAQPDVLVPELVRLFASFPMLHRDGQPTGGSADVIHAVHIGWYDSKDQVVRSFNPMAVEMKTPELPTKQ